MTEFKCPAKPVWADIKSAFSQGDIDCMLQKSAKWPKGKLDLSNYTSVYQYRDSINAAVVSGDMPEDDSEQPWAPLACWNTWYANGCPEK